MSQTETPANEPKRSTITRTKPENSSQIEDYGFDASRGILSVRFKNNRDGLPGPYVYEYSGVSQALFDELQAAESKGSFIRDKFVKPGWAFEKFPA